MELLFDPAPEAQWCAVGPQTLLCTLTVDAISTFPLEGSFIMHAFSEVANPIQQSFFKTNRNSDESCGQHLIISAATKYLYEW